MVSVVCYAEAFFWQQFNMGCGIATVKYLLFIFNLVFAVSSLLRRPVASIKISTSYKYMMGIHGRAR